MDYNKQEKSSFDNKRTTFSNKQVIWGASIIGFFIACAILTVAVGSEDDGSSYKTEEEDYTRNQDSADVKTIIDDYLSKLTSDSTDTLLNDIKLSQSEEDGNINKGSHFVKQEIPDTDPFEDLEKMVGLESVKEEVKNLMNYVKLMKEREAEGLQSPKVTYHCVFSGNPGTGKTTVARLLARMYKKLGIVSKGHMIETDRSGLIGKYTGQTAPKTNEIIDQAIGGVLFIDEAYSLHQGDHDAYGDEAISTLLKRMEDDRSDLVVIVAGYTEEMKKFIDTNPGLKSRFTRYIDFPDYTAEELYTIFEVRMEPYSIVLSPDADKMLQQALESVVKAKDRNFGNGRYVRNLFESAIANMANRLSNPEKHTRLELCTLTAEDIEYAIKHVKQ